MAQNTLRELVEAATRLGIRHVAGPVDDRAVERLDIVTLDGLAALAPGCLAIVSDAEPPAPYRLDVALRQASARGLACVLFAADLVLPETALALAERGGTPVFVAHDARPAELAVAIDRLLSGGASEAMLRATRAVERAAAVADDGAGVDAILAAAASALGAELALAADDTVAWTAHDAVAVGEVPVGRLTSPGDDPAATVAIPSIAALLSRAALRAMRSRFASSQSRSELIVQLVLAEASRVEGFVGPAERLGLPLQLSHAAAWLTPTALADPTAPAPRHVQAALELFALQLVEGREELWHVAFLQDGLLLVASEEPGAGDHQRRLRETAVRIQEHARSLAGPGWTYTLGLGTPQPGATGLRLSANEARIAAESAVAAGRAGGVEVTDVAGLGRVLLDVYASPVSRTLLGDLLEPL
ncbi:MAG: hypothetical protein QM598_10485, partial [Protaetiibacter sp.]